MKMRHLLTVLAACAALPINAGWAAKVTITTADLGPQPRDILSGVKAIAQTYLKDPDSAQYEIVSVFPGYCRQGFLRGGEVAWQGWAVNIMINARNSYGGYSGFEPHTVLFAGDTATQIFEGYDFGAYGPPKGLTLNAGLCRMVKN